LQTKLECYPCFIKQTLQTVKLVTSDLEKQKQVLDLVLAGLRDINLTNPPPKNSPIIYEAIAQVTGEADVYKQIKEKYNAAILKIYPQIITRINKSADPLFTALKFSIAGNIIDFGAGREIDINIDETLNKLEEVGLSYNDFDKFAPRLAKAKLLLYLADNAGEIVFDKAFLKIIKDYYPDLKIYLAVRGFPIINDVTTEDALAVKIDDFAEIISNGTKYPGTIIEECHPRLQQTYQQADLIISKGQGNFETLYETKRENLFYAFMIKCDCVAELLKLPLYSPIFMENPKFDLRDRS